MLNKNTPYFGLKICLLALFLFTGSAQSGVILDAVVSDPSVSVGSVFDVDLVISGLGNGIAPSVGAFNVILNFDALILSAAGVTFSSFLDGGLFFSLQSVASGLGFVDVAEISFLEGSLSECIFCFAPFLDDIQPDTFTLATLLFNAIGAGNSALKFGFVDIKDSDLDATELQVTANNGAVEVVAADVPEPNTILLVAIGFVSIVSLKRNRRPNRTIELAKPSRLVPSMLGFVPQPIYGLLVYCKTNYHFLIK